MGVRENHIDGRYIGQTKPKTKGLTHIYRAYRADDLADDLIGVCSIGSFERSLVRNGATGSRHHLSAIESYKCLHGCCIGVEMVCTDHMQEM